MARNGSGVYSLPAGSVIANGDTSDAADLNTPLADIEADLNTPRPVVAGGTGASTAADARTNLGFTLANLGVTATAAQINTVGQLAGRNRIINGQGRINQRVYVSGTNTSGANQYTLDRWRVVTSGQNLTFTGDDSKRTMTAPAGGVEQVIEGANIEGGTYVLNWTGTATATVDGTARTKGETFTLTANTNATVRFSSGTFTDVQLELGSSPTTFERLPLAQELANCLPYYEKSYDLNVAPATATTAGAQFLPRAQGAATETHTVRFAAHKRGTPTITVYARATGATGNVTNDGTTANVAVSGTIIGRSSFSVQFTAAATVPYSFHYAADAEL